MEQPVLPGPGGEIPEPRVHAVRVRLDRGALHGGGAGQHLPRESAEAEHAHLPVLREGVRAEELRQLPGGQPARQVHLEKPVLRVHEARGEGEIEAVGCLDGGHAAGIALDAHGGGKARHAKLAVETRQRAAQHAVRGGESGEQEDRQRGADVFQRPHERRRLSRARL